MPRATFYTHAPQVMDFACKLVDTIWRKGLSPYEPLWVWLADKDAAQTFSQRLWAHAEASFLAHECARVDEVTADIAPIWVVYGANGLVSQPPRLLMNMTGRMPVLPKERLLEVVGGHEADLQEARLRLRAYREAGWDTEHFSYEQAA